MANQSLIYAYPVEHLYIYFATREKKLYSWPKPKLMSSQLEAQAAIIAERSKANENHARRAVGDFVVRKKTSPAHSDKLSTIFYG